MPEPVYILALDTSGRACELALLSLVNGKTAIRCLTYEGSTQHAERILPLVEQLLLEVGIQRQALSAIAFGQGPGGFTGLRVACGIAQGLAFALQIDVVPVVSLFAAALTVNNSRDVRVVIQDARMNEVYVAAYQQTLAPVTPQQAATPDAVSQQTVDSDIAKNVACWHEIQAPVLVAAHDALAWVEQQKSLWFGTQTATYPSILVVGDGPHAYPGAFGALSGLGANNRPADAQQHYGGPVYPSARHIALVGLNQYLAGQTVPPHEASPLYVREKVAFTIAEREQGRGGNPAAGVPIRISPMVANDIQAVADIESGVQAFPWSLRNFQDALNAAYSAWVARLGNDILGFYIANYIDDLAHLLLIAVQPSRQRQGVGHQLLAHFEEQARAHNLRALTLEVRESNQAAINFYRNRGFQQTGLRKNYYRTSSLGREDALIFEKVLIDAVAKQGA